jgi:Pentapeptide repeats (8 copies)
MSARAAFIRAQEDFALELDGTIGSVDVWLQQTRWTWGLAGTAGIIVLTSPRARHRWPKQAHRQWIALALAGGLIALAGLTATIGVGKTLLILGGVVLVCLLAAWALVAPARLAPPLAASELERLSGSERLEAANARLKLQNDLRTTAMQAIAGLAVLAGAILAFQQLTEDRQQAAADRELTRQGQASERFTRAISQLGSNRREVQLGAIYGLEQIAKQAPDNRLVVTEVLVAYLHRRAPRSANATTAPSTELRERAPDVQAALTILGRRLNELDPLNLPYPPDPHLDLRALDLRGADLYQADLSLADLRGTDLRNATIGRVNLSFATLHRADLRGARLWQTTLVGADLRRADLRRTDLSEADLLEDPEVEYERANLHNAKADGRTKWPEGFDWRRAGAKMNP